MRIKKCLKLNYLSVFFSRLLLLVALFCCAILSNVIKTNDVYARTTTSFGIRDWTSDAGSTWHTLGLPDNVTNIGHDTPHYFRGVRLVNYGDWGDGDYYSGHVTINVTAYHPYPAPAGVGNIVNRVGSEYSSALSSNTLCSLGAYGTQPKSYSVSNFSATYLGGSIDSTGTLYYTGWLVEWDFSGQMSSSYSGSYDAYCRIYPGSANSEWFSADTAAIYLDNRTSMTFNVSESSTGSQIDQVLEAQQNTNSILQQIDNSINNINISGGASADDIADAISDKEQSEMQSAQTGADTSANSSGSQADSQGRTLLNGFTQFVDGVQQARPATCEIDFDLSRYPGGTNTVVDLCSLSKPEYYNYIASIVVAIFVVRLSVTTVTKMLALYKEYSE